MNYREIIESKGFLLLAPKGNSMLPFIHPHTDIIKLINAKGPYKKYQVILFQKGPDYILHRIIKVTDSKLFCIGDNEFVTDIVDCSDVIAIMEGLYRKEKYIHSNQHLSLIFISIWHILTPLRRVIKKIHRSTRGGKS
jgi:hypothetical protein